MESHHSFFSGVKSHYWDFVLYLGDLHTTINASVHWVQSLHHEMEAYTVDESFRKQQCAESMNLVKDWLPQMHSGRGITAAPMTPTGF